jgi:predicted DNA-binding transcriptional regulator YafY
MISLMEILLNEVGGPTDSLIIDAINNNKIITIYYKGDKETAPGWRTGVIPVCFGITNGKKYLRAWQTAGKTLTYTPEWKLFRVDRIRNWNVAGTKKALEVPDNRFNPSGDKQISRIIAIAKYK